MAVAAVQHVPSGALRRVYLDASAASMVLNTIPWSAGRRLRVTGMLNYNSAPFVLSCAFNGTTYERAATSTITNTSGVVTFPLSADLGTIQGETFVDMLIVSKRLIALARTPALIITSAACRVSALVSVNAESFATGVSVAGGTGLESFTLSAVTDAFAAGSYLDMYDAGVET